MKLFHVSIIQLTAHTARDSIQLLRTIFSNRLISGFCDVPWAPRSPDLTPLDFFLRRYLKEKVYINRPRTLEDLKMNICQEIRNITPDILRKVMEFVTKRMGMCINTNSKHLNNIILKYKLHHILFRLQLTRRFYLS